MDVIISGELPTIWYSMKRLAQGREGGGIITKKVIIATINGTQRILTPVSSL